MAVELVIEVVAHVKRKDMAENLCRSVQSDHLYLDDGALGEWKNHMRAWRHAENSGATHAVILQDDAVPIDGFREVVIEAIKRRPDDLIGLYVGTRRPRGSAVLEAVKKAELRPTTWLTADTLMWGVGVVVPVSLIPEILSTVASSRLPYDQRIGLWAESTGRDVYYTWPSLVDHQDEPTVIAGRHSNQGVRVAHKTGMPIWDGQTIRIEHPELKILGSKRDRLLPKP